MKTANLLIFLVAFNVSNMAIAQPAYPHIMESITWKSFHLIEIALPEATRRNLVIDNYRISVSETETSFFVLFDDPERPTGQRGNTGKMLCLQVEISKDGLKVVRSNFIR